MGSTFSKSVVQIDKLGLDKECVNLASNYLQASEQASEAKRDVVELESALKVVESELSMEIRANPQDYGLEKVTESGITAIILKRSAYQKALKALQAAQYHHDLCTGLVWALEHKKRALTLLVDLHRMSYYAAVRKKGSDDEGPPSRSRRNLED